MLQSFRLLILFFLLGNTTYSQDKSLDQFRQQWDAASGEEKITLLYQNLPVMANRERLPFLMEAIAIARDRQKTKTEAELYLKTGLTWYGIGDYPKTLEFLQKALSLQEQLGDFASMGRTYNEMATFVKKQKDYSKALEYLDRSRELCTGLDTVCLGTSFNNRGLVFAEQQDWTTAEKNYRIALNLYQQIGDTLGMGYVYANLAEVASINNDYTKALQLLEQSTHFKSLSNDLFGVAMNTTNTGELLFKQGEYQRAITYFEKSTANTDHVDLQQWNHRFVSRCYAALGKTEEALAFLSKSYALKDSLFSAKRIADLAEMQTKYETEKKEQKILLQASELERQEQKFRNQLILFGTGTLALLCIGLLAFYIYRQRQRSLVQQQEMVFQKQLLHNTLEVQEAERKRIAKDLHDGIGQQLTGLKMAWRNLFERISPQVPEEANQFVQLNTVLEEAAEEVRSISHQMMPRALQELGLLAALEDLLDKTFFGSGITCTFDHHGLEERLPESIEVHLFRVIQELLNNLMKHSQATEVDIQLYKSKNQLVVVLEDNGIGFQVDESNRKGLGMLSIASRLRAINGQIDRQSEPGQGTLNTLKIPLA